MKVVCPMDRSGHWLSAQVAVGFRPTSLASMIR
jgi:hypothetical protein